MITRDVAEREQHRLQDMLKELYWIESATLIGRPISERWIERINDLDNVIIVRDKMTEDRYHALEALLENLKNGASKDVDVMYAIADGPMKPPSEKENEVFFHIILHTEETYKKSPLLLVENSWQYENPYLGKPVHEIRRIQSGVTKDMLLHGALGIEHLTELVKKNESAYLGWEKTESGVMQMKIYPITFKEIDEQLELYFYSILRCASNTLRLITKNNKIGIGQDMCDLFKKTCRDFKYNRLPQEVHTDKRLLRNRQLILSGGFAKRYQIQAIEFLEALDRYIDKTATSSRASL